MIVTLTFKTPDAAEDAAVTAATEAMYGNFPAGTPGEDDEAGREKYEEEWDEYKEVARKAVDKFVRYGEYLTVEIDTDTGTARVVPAK